MSQFRNGSAQLIRRAESIDVTSQRDTLAKREDNLEMKLRVIQTKTRRAPLIESNVHAGIGNYIELATLHSLAFKLLRHL